MTECDAIISTSQRCCISNQNELLTDRARHGGVQTVADKMLTDGSVERRGLARPLLQQNPGGVKEAFLRHFAFWLIIITFIRRVIGTLSSSSVNQLAGTTGVCGHRKSRRTVGYHILEILGTGLGPMPGLVGAKAIIGRAQIQRYLGLTGRGSCEGILLEMLHDALSS